MPKALPHHTVSTQFYLEKNWKHRGVTNSAQESASGGFTARAEHPAEHCPHQTLLGAWPDPTAELKLSPALPCTPQYPNSAPLTTPEIKNIALSASKCGQKYLEDSCFKEMEHDFTWIFVLSRALCLHTSLHGKAALVSEEASRTMCRRKCCAKQGPVPSQKAPDL